MTKPLILLALTAILAACYTTHPLDKRYVSVRPNYGERPLPNPGGEPEPQKPLEIVNPDPSQTPSVPEVREIITGTWTFTTPPTTTRVERRDANLSQTSIYMGRPKPDDTPLVVITVSRDAKSVVENEPNHYKVRNTRTYVLNGNVAKEWTGVTDNGAAFNELLISRPGEKGDLCHALAIASGAEERRLAVEILGSITWKASDSAPQGPASEP